MYCNCCGEDFEQDCALVCDIDGVQTEMCPECESTGIEELEEEPEWCSMCSGTGISPSGRVDDSCSTCGGYGVERSEREY